MVQALTLEASLRVCSFWEQSNMFSLKGLWFPVPKIPSFGLCWCRKSKSKWLLLSNIHDCFVVFPLHCSSLTRLFPLPLSLMRCTSPKCLQPKDWGLAKATEGTGNIKEFRTAKPWKCSLPPTTFTRKTHFLLCWNAKSCLRRHTA